MYYVKHKRAYGHYLYVYPVGHSLHKLKYAWTLDRMQATKFKTGEEAVSKLTELGVPEMDADWTTVEIFRTKI